MKKKIGISIIIVTFLAIITFEFITFLELIQRLNN